MMLTKDIPIDKHEPDLMEMGKLANRFFNIIDQAKAGKVSIALATDSIQKIAEGWSIVEDMFSEEKEIDRIPALNSVHSFRWLCTLSCLKLKLGSNSHQLDTLLDLPDGGSLECGMKRLTYGRSIPVPASKVWSRLIHNSEEGVAHLKVINQYGLGGAAFTPAQVGSILARVKGGTHFIDLHMETKLFIFCQLGSVTALLEVVPAGNEFIYTLHWPDQPWIGKDQRLLLRIP